MDERNVYIYWVGKEYTLISILRNLIYLHSTSGKGYKVHLITDKNINEYIGDVPSYFNKLLPAHQADFVRVNVICDFGGIWLDSDTLVLHTLDSLFDLIENNDGFFIKQNNDILFNGIFGSKKQTPLMLQWKTNLLKVLNDKKENILWAEIGNLMLKNIYDTNSLLYNNYKIFNGLDNLYPVNWDSCVNEFIEKSYDNYKNIIREYQPLIVLVHHVYKHLEYKTEKEILEGIMPLNYFINLSLINSNLDTKPTFFTNKQVFENIYNTQRWNNGDPNVPLSGPGSSFENTRDISNLLHDFIYTNNCSSILDLGCGDLTWMSKTSFFNDDNINYTGIDVVESLITAHSNKYPIKNFICEDITQYKDFDEVSLIIIRDVIFHLKNKEILSIFENIRNKFKFLCITSCKNIFNTDDFNMWRFSEKNINIVPFNKSNNVMIKLDEDTFDRCIYIYKHESFYTGENNIQIEPIQIEPIQIEPTQIASTEIEIPPIQITPEKEINKLLNTKQILFQKTVNLKNLQNIHKNIHKNIQNVYIKSTTLGVIYMNDIKSNSIKQKPLHKLLNMKNNIYIN
jgi:SAM-dependent methyltransferase